MFTNWDYCVCALVLLVSLGIGFFHGCFRKQKTTKDFLHAGGNMGVLPVSLSLLASFMSAITVLGTPAEMYVYGTQYCMIWMGYAIMLPVAAYLFLPIFHGLKLTSVFEYLELRFSKNLRLIVYMIYVFQTLMYMAIALYSPALALNIVTGLNVWVCVLSVGIVCTFYTALGGMKATMWADVFQIAIMFSGILAVLARGAIDHGGFGNIWNKMREGDRTHMLDFNPDPRARHTMWTLSIGAAFTWVSIYGINQAQVQRALCTSSLKSGQRALLLNFPGLTLLMIICSMTGFVVYAEYKDCDPLTSKHITRDQLLPLYVLEKVNWPLMPGLFTASVFSGALSSISGGLNSLAAVTLQDVIRNVFTISMHEETATKVSRMIALGYGVLMMFMTFVASQLGGVLEAALGLFGMLGGPTLGLFLLGIVFPWANAKGAYAGYAVGLMCTIWLGVGNHIYNPAIPKAPISVAGCAVDNVTSVIANWTSSAAAAANYTVAPTTAAWDASTAPGYISFYETSYLWYSCFAVFIVISVGLTVSYFTGLTNPRELDPKLISPIFDIFCCCLPRRARNYLHFNVQRPEVDDCVKQNGTLNIIEIDTIEIDEKRDSRHRMLA